MKVMPGKLTMVKFRGGEEKNALAGCLLHHGDRPWVVLPGDVHLQVGEEDLLEYLLFINYLLYRRRSKAGFKGSKVGFQKLTDKSEVFTDSDEEDIEFDK